MGSLISAVQSILSRIALWVVIAPWEQGVRVRAGRHVRTLAPGWHFLIPLLDIVYRQSTRLRSQMLPSQTIQTKDGKILTFGGSVVYSVASLEVLMNALHDANDTIIQLAGESVADCVSKTESAILTPSVLSDAASKELKAALSGVGLDEVKVRVTDFSYPRAIRLIQDHRWSQGGDGLDTNSPV